MQTFSSGGGILRALAVNFFAIGFAIALWSQQDAALSDKTLYVGLIQDDRRDLIKNVESGTAANRVIIPVFSKDGSEWKSIHELNENLQWTVAFDGKNLGQVRSRPDPPPEVVVQPNVVERSEYVRAVHAILTPPSKVPTVGQRSGKFSGGFGGTVRRPLVVVSRPNIQDPDHWKPGTLPSAFVQPVRVAFREAYRHIRQCDAQGEPLKKDWEVPSSELSLIRAYASDNRSFIVETRLKNNRCVFDVEEGKLTNLEGTQWFVVSADGKARGIGSDLELVDAGDYDSDGASELIFFFGNGETGKEGYVLFYNNFRQKAIAEWIYK